jgi:hypothetical protein
MEQRTKELLKEHVALAQRFHERFPYHQRTTDNDKLTRMGLSPHGFEPCVVGRKALHAVYEPTGIERSVRSMSLRRPG